MKAMIFAAGLGSRLRPLTSNIPKALVEINGIPLLHLVLRKLISSGFDEIIINVHHKAEMVCKSVDSFNTGGAIIKISDESDLLLETGGGLKKASWFFNDSKPFLLHNVDVLSDLDLSKLYQDHSKSRALATLAISKRATSRYLLFDDQLLMKGWKNSSTGEIKPPELDDSRLAAYAFSGIHVINSEFLDNLTENGKFSLIETYLRLCNNFKIRGYIHSAKYWLDIGNPQSLERARTNFDIQKFT
jgi:NDP-sugar pyrophosphorylase family protein